MNYQSCHSCWAAKVTGQGHQTQMNVLYCRG